jgi:hypothetical protein
LINIQIIRPDNFYPGYQKCIDNISQSPFASFAYSKVNDLFFLTTQCIGNPELIILVPNIGSEPSTSNDLLFKGIEGLGIHLAMNSNFRITVVAEILNILAIPLMLTLSQVSLAIIGAASAR